MKKSFAFVLAAAFLFGTMEVALKLAGSSFNAMQLTFLRFLIGGICLLPFAMFDLKKRQYRLTVGDWAYFFLLGFVNICISMVLFQLGVMRTNANLAAVIISTSPIFTMIFAQFIVNEKFTAKKAVVLILNVIGLIIVANPVTLFSGKSAVSGILLTLVAAVAFGLYTALGKKRIEKIGGLTQNSLSFILGSSVLLVVLLVTKQPVVGGIQLSTLPLLLYLSIFVTAIGYYCYLKAIEVSGPSTASITFFIKPIFAPIIAFAVLNEAITVNLVFGVVFILAGSLVSIARDKYI
ncbi:MAG TPA: DMT family transporter [Methylomusa anaerophila]|uniref:DMT family transporter n=1 Tax=Methylomusa anaerophila TaxID=1930071 RepID=UPI0013158E9E|nr:DMT family transporter [Methylomusa anaerophila]HML87333.1 DMT family transporter [Methylomusa anaerophila]